MSRVNPPPNQSTDPPQGSAANQHDHRNKTQGLQQRPEANEEPSATGISEAVKHLIELLPPHPRRHGQLLSTSKNEAGETRKKIITSSNHAPDHQLIQEHLTRKKPGGRKASFQAIGYLPLTMNGEQALTTVGMLDIDGKNYADQPGVMEQDCNKLRDVARAFGWHAYYEQSTSGNGWHVYIFADEAIPLQCMVDTLTAWVQVAGLVKAERIELFPRNTNPDGLWYILPYAGAAADPKRLGDTFLITAAGQPIHYDEVSHQVIRTPVKALEALVGTRPTSHPPASPTTVTDPHIAAQQAEAATRIETSAREARTARKQTLNQEVSGVVPAPRSAGLEAEERVEQHHWSHSKATKQLLPYEKALRGKRGNSSCYDTIHALTRISLEHATPDEPSPDLFIVNFALSALLGVSTRTIIRNLSEDKHSWSSTVASLFARADAYGARFIIEDPEERAEREKRGEKQPSHGVKTGAMLRIFPNERQHPEDIIRQHHNRDLIAESRAGRTAPARQKHQTTGDKQPLLSPHISILTTINEANLPILALTQEPVQPTTSQYNDTLTKLILEAARSDLDFQLAARPDDRGITKLYTEFVDKVADTLVRRFDDAKFRPMWCKLLWACLRTEIHSHNNPGFGWHLVQRLITTIEEMGREPGVNNPCALAWQTTIN